MSSRTAAKSDASRIRVQIVDDQALVRECLAALLDAAEGLSVCGTAASADEAIQLAKKQSPDVIVMDVQMPGRSVFDAVTTIRASSASMRIILLDDFPVDANVRAALHVGAAGYLTKRDSLREIELAIHRAADGERVFSAAIAKRIVTTAHGLSLPHGKHDSPLSTLTPRELEVLVYLAQGFTVKQCAEALGISASTVDNHKSRMMRKLRVHKTVDLTRMAIREGLTPG